MTEWPHKYNQDEASQMFLTLQTVSIISLELTLDADVWMVAATHSAASRSFMLEQTETLSFIAPDAAARMCVFSGADLSGPAQR